MKKIHRIIQPFFIKLNSFKIFDKLGRLYYHLGLKIFISACTYFPQIKSIYARHSFASEDWIPWASDIDITVVIDDMDTDSEIKFLNKFWLIHRATRIPFPFINHIDIFNLEELKSDLLYEEPLLSVLINNCNLLYGDDHRKIINRAGQNVYWVRVAHWAPFMQWFYKDDFNKKLYARKYYNFFNKLLHFAQECNVNAEGLGSLLSYARDSNFWLRVPGDFVFRIYYHSLNILGAIYAQQPNAQTLPTKFEFTDNGKDSIAFFSHNINTFVNSLSEMKNYIRSIFIDAGSIQHTNYRIWIILDNSVEEKDFIKFAGLVKKTGQYFLKMNVYPYIFLENALNFFLTSRWFWPFEYYHLKSHSRLIFGENLFNENNRPSDSSVIDMCCKSGFFYRYRLRNLLNNINYDEYLKFIAGVMARKIFLEKNIIATTLKELIKICADSHSRAEGEWIIKLINKKRINKERFYSLAESILRNEPKQENIINEKLKINEYSLK